MINPVEEEIVEQQTTTAAPPQAQADEADYKFWPWLTERRAFALSWVMFGLAVYFRFAGGEG